MPTRTSRTLGALIGLHAGDSFGATYEFQPPQTLRDQFPNGHAGFPRDIVGGVFSWPAGAPTDDTDLTRAVLLAYRDAIIGPPSSSKTKPNHHSRDVVVLSADYFLSWYQGKNWPNRLPGAAPVDVGAGTAKALEFYRHSKDPYVHRATSGSHGNGSLMRCIPTALFQPDPHLLIQQSIAISGITHHEEPCPTACAVYNSIVSAMVLHDMDAHDAVKYGEKVALRLEKGLGPVGQTIKLGRRTRLAEVVDRGPKACGLSTDCRGYVLDTLALGVASVLDDRPMDDVLVDVVRVGMDTDTNAAVAGGLLGARDGLEAVPRRWRSMLLYADEFRYIAMGILEKQGIRE